MKQIMKNTIFVKFTGKLTIFTVKYFEIKGGTLWLSIDFKEFQNFQDLEPEKGIVRA